MYINVGLMKMLEDSEGQLQYCSYLSYARAPPATQPS